MDGTILTHQNQVTVKTKEVIDQLRSKGILVFIATGRSFDEIEALVPEGFQVDGFISSNGMAAHVDGVAVMEHSLPLDLVEKVIEKARKHKVYYELFPNKGSRFTLKEDRHFLENEIRDPRTETVGINEWMSRKEAIKSEIEWKDVIEGDKFSKFYCFSRSKEHINTWKKELEELKKEIDFTMSISSEHNVEIMVANVNKATGIEYILNKHNLTANDIVGIGDSDNDIPMLKFVGHSVAMKNAPDHIKELVDDVTDFTCDEDGVSDYLEKHFL
ncbi:HAD family phosphatase [Metabacillus litoralis]|uniref:HAD family phosphatase n=2 Tax=Metabacillus litoralis TaxID=152268 RepID=A0A5C6VF98_9BACI|nr:HAD family phosphatase [Metabacillus litoralis]